MIVKDTYRWPRGSLFKNEKSLPGNQRMVMGEAGGGLPRNTHAR